MNFTRLLGLFGVAAVSLLALIWPASAETCFPDGSVSICVEGVYNRTGSVPPISGLLDLSSVGSGSNHQVYNGPGALTFGSGANAITASFTPSGSTNTGVFAGNVSGVAASVFGNNNSTTNYFSAGQGGSVTLKYATAQSELDMLWGTVDQGTTRNFLRPGLT